MNSRALAQRPGSNLSTIKTSPPPDNSLPVEGVSPLTKQYVVPPRPKPGRKPATDTPPTRRKAQNRAAQRAFRERRAAKVNRLEDELAEMRRQHEAEVARLHYERDMHVRNVQSYYESSMQHMSKENSSLRERTTNLQDAFTTGRQTVGISDEDAQRSYQTPPTIEDGCGNCTVESSCACVEDAFEMSVATETKRLPSPHPEDDRVKKSRALPVEELETDFTSLAPPAMPIQQRTIPVQKVLLPKLQRMPPIQRQLPSIQQQISPTQQRISPTHQQIPQIQLQLLPDQQQPSDSGAQIDPCGFCTSENDCPCEEIIAGCTTEFDTEVKTEEEIPSLIDTACADGPGSCDTCQTNPVVSILCQTFSASQSPELSRRAPPPPQTQQESAPCAMGDACCRVSDMIAQNTSHDINSTTDLASSSSAITIPCDTAFEQLQKHKAFNRAAKDLSSWMHLLKTRATTRQRGSAETANSLEVDHTTANRSHFEIEAASVLSVLQYYDRRYGTDEP